MIFGNKLMQVILFTQDHKKNFKLCRYQKCISVDLIMDPFSQKIQIEKLNINIKKIFKGKIQT